HDAIPIYHGRWLDQSSRSLLRRGCSRPLGGLAEPPSIPCQTGESRGGPRLSWSHHGAPRGTVPVDGDLHERLAGPGERGGRRRGARGADGPVSFGGAGSLPDAPCGALDTQRSGRGARARGERDPRLPSDWTPGADWVKGKSRSDREPRGADKRSEEHTSELQSREKLVCRLLLEKKK